MTSFAPDISMDKPGFEWFLPAKAIIERFSIVCNAFLQTQAMECVAAAFLPPRANTIRQALSLLAQSQADLAFPTQQFAAAAIRFPFRATRRSRTSEFGNGRVPNRGIHTFRSPILSYTLVLDPIGFQNYYEVNLRWCDEPQTTLFTGEPK